MEPINTTLHVRPDGAELWVGTQVPARAQAAVAKETGLPLEKVVVHNQYMGGAFGRRLDVDSISQAARIAKHVNYPVKLIWTREEDMQHDYYRPYYYDRVSGGLNADGAITGWTHRTTGSSVMARWAPPGMKMGGKLDPDTVECSVEHAVRSARAPGGMGAFRAGCVDHGVVARRRPDAQRVHRGKLRRRARGGGWKGPAGIPARPAGEEPARACGAQPGGGEGRLGLARGARRRPRHRPAICVRHLSRDGAGDRGVQGRRYPVAQGQCRGGLRPGGQPEHRRGTDPGRPHLRPDHGAV